MDIIIIISHSNNFWSFVPVVILIKRTPQAANVPWILFNPSQDIRLQIKSTHHIDIKVILRFTYRCLLVDQVVGSNKDFHPSGILKDSKHRTFLAFYHKTSSVQSLD